jgi:hypothetical protein
MRPALTVAALLAAGCNGDSAQAPPLPPDTNQIEKLSTPATVEEDPREGVRLAPLTEQDLADAGFAAQGCSFRSNGALFIVTSGTGSIVRIGGQIVHLMHSSPVGPSGGFLEKRPLSISIGRTEAGAFDASVGAPARAAITNRQNKVQAELIGIWACRG